MHNPSFRRERDRGNLENFDSYFADFLLENKRFILAKGD